MNKIGDMCFNVVVKVSYKITSMSGRIDKREEVKIEPEVHTYKSALNTAMGNLLALSTDLTDDLEFQLGRLTEK